MWPARSTKATLCCPKTSDKRLRRVPSGKFGDMVGILIAVLLAALVYILLIALTGSAIVAIVGAILVLIAGVPTGGYGLGRRWS
jgi:high-affinity Fe2+/Pb2+ permease